MRTGIQTLIQTRETDPQILSRLKELYPGARYYLNFSSPLELLIATILSAQVRDTVVNAVTPRLFGKYKTAADYAGADLETLIREITPVSFPANKAKHIREACKILVEKYHGAVPDTMEQLVELPGVGRKTANAILINAFGKVEGIVVDTHVIRVAYRLGWTKNKNPEKIERDLTATVPREDWARITWLLKEHGKAVCKAPVPVCSRCGMEPLCPKGGIEKKM
ncbi:MAG: endonuclease III [Nitrospirae bacterium]|nr:endonuclease III [Nitrospirota bacterium]